MSKKMPDDTPYQEFIQQPGKQQLLYKKTLRTIFLAQAFGGAGLGAGITVGALLAQEMIGSDSSAGLPTALFTLGSALGALIIGMSSQKYGRRLGLAGGFFTGSIGSLGIIFAAISNNIPFLLLSMFIYGAGMASNLQTRYAGTDLASEKQRGKAASIALVSTTLGAVIGPNLIGPMGQFAKSIGIPTLAGPFILSGFAFLLAGLIIFTFLKPDPLLVSMAIAKASNKASIKGSTDLTAVKVNKNGLFLGALVMVLAQLVMTAIMTMTPIHMGHHGHGLSQIGLVIGLHIAAMYLPSLLTGILVDKLGRKVMAVASAGTFLCAGVVAALAPPDSLFLLIVALVLLGIGWNFGLLSGTALLIDSTHISIRAKIQGRVDVLVALSGATGGVLSGIVFAQTSYAFLSLSGAVIALFLLPLMLRSKQAVT